MDAWVTALTRDIEHSPENAAFTKMGIKPLFTAGSKAKIAIIGQAPGKKAQDAGIIWGDASGDKLMNWLGIDEKTFRDTRSIALLPMDFYYPGKGKSGDLPPRKGFAPLWHKKLLEQMPDIRLYILIGAYAQAYYLGKRRKKNLTETVRAFEEYLPTYFPLVHPSPLNFRWQAKNPWFESDVLPRLKHQVRQALSGLPK